MVRVFREVLIVFVMSGFIWKRNIISVLSVRRVFGGIRILLRISKIIWVSGYIVVIFVIRVLVRALRWLCIIGFISS